MPAAMSQYFTLRDTFWKKTKMKFPEMDDAGARQPPQSHVPYGGEM